MNKSALIALLRQKKIFIPAAIIVCILIVITIWSFFIPLPKNSFGITSQQPTPSGTRGQSNSTTAIVPTTTPQVTQQVGTLYKSTKYTIAYPPGWNVTSQPVVSGGSLVTMVPAGLPAGDIYPQLTVEYDTNNTPPVDIRETAYQQLGFINTPTTLDGSPGSKITGTLPIKEQNGITVRSPLQMTTIYLAKGNSAYLIRYEYDDSAPDQTMESYFKQIVQTFRFTTN